MPAIHIDPAEALLFLGVLLRVGLSVFLSPLFTEVPVPAQVKALASLAICGGVYPVARAVSRPFAAGLLSDPFSILLLAAGEVFFAGTLALAVHLLLAAFEMAGEVLSFQMGFGFAQVAEGTGQVTVLGKWLKLAALLLLFQMDGHHALIGAVAESFRAFPVGGVALHEVTLWRVVELSASLFKTAVGIAAPVMAALLLVHAALGVIARFAPQVNILTMSFPVTIAAGLLLLGFGLPALAALSGRLFSGLARTLWGLSAG